MSLSKVKVKISSQVKNEGDPAPEVTEEEAVGVMHCESGGDVRRVSYKTKTEGALIQTVIEPYGSSVRLIREGALESNIVFEVGLTHTSLYKIPPFTFNMSVLTTRLENTLSPLGGTLLLEYEMNVGGAKKLCELHISAIPC